jgi:hypothetical protein
VPAGGDQDLEYLLRPCVAEVTRPENADIVADLERPEQPDPQAFALSAPLPSLSKRRDRARSARRRGRARTAHRPR